MNLNKRANSRFYFLFNNKLLKSKRSNSRLCFENYLFKIPKSKRSQGEVVATVLLILLAISAVVMIMGFVIPFVKKNLDKSCFDYNGKIEIKNDDTYTCYDNTNHILSLRVRVGDLDDDFVPLKGFAFIMQTNGVTESFKISPPEASPGVTSYSGAVIDLPKENGERTYNFTLNNGGLRPNLTTIYPILNNSKECSEAKYELDTFPYC